VPTCALFAAQDSADANGEKRVSLKKQNDYLMDVLFDDAGELKYHSDCVVRIFTISKGRLSVRRHCSCLLLRSFFFFGETRPTWLCGMEPAALDRPLVWFGRSIGLLREPNNNICSG
jgi:hypothetical protein